MLIDEQTNHEAMAELYTGGASAREVARAVGVSNTTVLKRLRDAGVKVRGEGRAQQPAPRAVHRAVRHLDAILGAGWQLACQRSGMSLNWWRTIRRGRYSPTVDNFEAMANAAGYELVLRRRVG